MLWFTWRQFRTQGWIALAALVAVGVTLAVTGAHLSGLWTDSGAAACRSGCAAPIARFLAAAGNDYTAKLYDASTMLLYVAPALVGLFWGAPLVAREVESGTHRLSWNQSVTRTRWLVTKLAVGGGASVAVVGLLSLGIGLWAHHLDQQNRIGPLLFGVRGIVPVGYAAFAFVLGVTAGAVLRRTLPAMAVTLAVYIAAVAAMPLWVRAHLMPLRHAQAPFDTSRLDSLTLTPGGEVRVVGTPDIAGWVLSNHTVTPAGQPFFGPADPAACAPSASERSCMSWLDSLNLRESLGYQPASRFWPLQLVETGIFLALTALLVAVCVRALRRTS